MTKSYGRLLILAYACLGVFAVDAWQTRTQLRKANEAVEHALQTLQYTNSVLATTGDTIHRTTQTIRDLTSRAAGLEQALNQCLIDTRRKK